MKIKYIKIKNFRGYKDETVVPFTDLVVLVGKNDIGKSTVLEALDLFFTDGNGIVKYDKSDINVDGALLGNNDLEITVCFCDLPTEVLIDSSVYTTLEQEFMLNSDKSFEVVKRYKNTGKYSTYIRAIHPTNPKCNGLLLKKNGELKKIISREGIECPNQSINSFIRRAIWNHFSDELDLKEIEIEVSKEDAKKIWEKLSGYLPIYTLFQSERKNSDGDSEVQDPLKEAVKQILNEDEVKKALYSVAQIVTAKLNDVSNRTLEKLNEMDPGIAGSLNPVILPPEKLKWAEVFKSVSITGDENIPINKRGSGVKRLVLLNFFRAEAEKQHSDRENGGIVYAIEEPETSQHPNNQRMLITALKKLSQASNTQVLLTTHSPTIVKELDFSDIHLVHSVEGKKTISHIDRNILTYPSLNEVNFLAFGEATEEYHNELYSFIEAQCWKNDFKQGRPTIGYYQQVKNKNGIEISIKKKYLILSEYIRHQIHHPENSLNSRYSPDMLKKSIEEMRTYIYTRLLKETGN